MALPEYKSPRNYTWQNISMSLAAFAQKLSPYLSGGAGGTYQNIGNSSTVSNINWAQATVQELNLDSSPTLTFSNGVEGASLSLLLKNGLTPRSITWPSDVTWSRGVQPTIANLPENGSIDPSFESGTGFTQYSSPVQSITQSFVLSTGKILIWNNTNNTGGFTYNGTSVSDGLIRLNADGTLDSTFANLNWAINTGSTIITSVLELPDGRLLVGGNFSDGGATLTFGNAALQLLSADGIRDNSFTPSFVGGMPWPSVYSIVRQSTGKIVVSGEFTQVNGVSHYSLARFNADLTLDATFTAGIGNMSAVNIYSLALGSDDSIFVGGSFDASESGAEGTAILKLDANGAVSPFNYGAGFGGGMMMFPTVYDIKVTAGGKVVIGGDFSTYNGTSIGSGIVRLNADGTVDSTFVTGTGVDSLVRVLLLLPNDKVVAVSESGTDYNGTTISRLFILNNVGAIDTTIPIPSTGLSGGGMVSNYGLALQSTGDILVTGAFTTYGGKTANSIVSISVNSATSVYSTVDFKYNGVEYIGSF
jgi:uncharacterized delta-60 repeat protein